VIVAGSITPSSLIVAPCTHWFPPTIEWSTRWTAVPIGAVCGAAVVVVEPDVAVEAGGVVEVDGDEEAVEQPARAVVINRPTVTRLKPRQFI
jgi:hypothetical protein